MNAKISFVANAQLMGDGYTPSTMDFFRGQQYPWLSTILPLLTQANYSWEVLDWKDTNICWNEKPIVILGPVWGYFEEQELFLKWVHRLKQSGVTLHNSTDFILWNFSKTYLLDLQKFGIPIPYTRIIDQNDTLPWHIVVEAFMQECNSQSCILKGVVDAAASSFVKVDKHSIATFNEQFEQTKQFRQGVILQEYLPEVNQCGELSFVFFNGQLGHTFLKVPQHDEDRVQVFFGGKSFHISDHQYQQCIDQITANFRSDFQLSAVKIALAHQQALSYIEKIRLLLDTKDIPFPLYLRLDGVMSGDRLLVMELEGIEPYMELNEALEANSNCRSIDLYVEAIIHAQQSILYEHIERTFT